MAESGDTRAEGVLSPRGTAQKSSWISTVDFKVAYELNIPTGQLVRFRADVFNVFNAQGVQKRDEVGELTGRVGASSNPAAFYPLNPNYGQATTYQTPRAVRLGLDIEF